MSGRLEGKVAVVTGAGSGMGRSIALLFACERAKVIAGDMRERALALMRTKATLGREGTPEEIAEAALWLSSSNSSFVNGAALTVDGGWSCRAF